MYYGSTKLVAPNPRNDPEYAIPASADLRGVCYDYADQRVVVYDHAESKLMWIDRDTATMLRSVPFALPKTSDQLIDACSFHDVYWALLYKGDGHLSICQGAFSDMKDKNETIVIEYPVPYHTVSIPSNLFLQTVFNYTHNSPLRWLRYSPTYCSLFNIGYDLYLTAGLSYDVNSFSPPELGQWVFQYDLAGFINKIYKADDTVVMGSRPYFLDEAMNGRIVAMTCHDGVLAGLAVGLEDTAILKTLKPAANTYTTTNHAFVAGKWDKGASICSIGKRLYYTSGGKLFSTETYMFEVWADDYAKDIGTTIDMGTIGAGGTITRKVYIKNVSPYYTYRNVIIRTVAASMWLSYDVEDKDWSDALKFVDSFPVGETRTFYLRITTDSIPESDLPQQYFEDLVITAAADWEHLKDKAAEEPEEEPEEDSEESAEEEPEEGGNSDG